MRLTVAEASFAQKSARATNVLQVARDQSLVTRE
jgi:hypothetical protein